MSIASVNSSSIQADYMKLLVTQLQNQNPLEPMDNNQMASQMAQFSQLQQLESMNSSFEQSLNLANRNYATSLAGKNVSFAIATDSGASVLSGKVEHVYVDEKGEIVLSSGGKTFGLADIVSIDS